MWKLLGKVVYWISWPALFLYLKIGKRTRIGVIYDGKVLVVKPWMGSGRWILPGGGLRRGESSLGGVLRELREETGVEVDKNKVKKTGEHSISINGISTKYILFKVVTEEKLIPKASGIEIVQTKWMPLEQAKSYVTEFAYLIK